MSTLSQFIGNGTIPIGGIIMWSGSVATIPTGWALCNGSNATPDLRERFIVGAGGDNSTVAGTTGYNPGDNGGANTVALTTAQMPSHDHGGVTGADGAHTHLTSQNYVYGLGSSGRQSGGANAVQTYSETNTMNLAPAHTHTISAQGGGEAHENRPPYFALAFIMRIA